MSHGHYPGPSEPLQPITEADVQYMVTPEGAGYEHTDANVWQITKFALWLAITAVVVHLGLGVMYKMLIEQSKVTTDQQPYPLASTTEPRLPPEPRLQQFPRTEYYQFRLAEQQKLESYGWVNKDAGVVHIPIEQAMRLTLERGMLESTPPAQPETPGLMPSDSSSGRVTERRRE
jgi:hypothetical protein